MSSPDYNAIVAQIDSFVPQHNGDVTIRCGSLNPEQPDEERSWFGEVATGNVDATADTPTFGDLLQQLSQTMGAVGGN